MKKSAKILIIFFVLVAELVWLARPQLSLHGLAFDEPYRHNERVAAMAAWHTNPSPETQKAYDEEMALFHRHMDEQLFGFLAVIFVFDVALICLLWRRVPTIEVIPRQS